MLQGFKIKNEQVKEQLDALCKSSVNEENFTYSLAGFICSRIYKEKLDANSLISNDDFKKVMLDVIKLAKERQNLYNLETKINDYNNIHYLIVQVMAIPYGNYLKDYVNKLNELLKDKDNLSLYYIKDAKNNLNELLKALA